MLLPHVLPQMLFLYFPDVCIDGFPLWATVNTFPNGLSDTFLIPLLIPVAPLEGE